MSAPWRLWRGALLLAMAALAALYAAVALRYFAFPYGDLGWAIDHIVWNAWQLARGQAVYTDPALGDPGAFMYTPGFTFLVWPLVALFGPQLWTARLVNLIGAALLVTLVTRETAGRVRDRRLLLFAPGLVFLLGAANSSSLIVVHPEVWGVTFALLALGGVRRVIEGRGAALVPAVLWTCAAVATKQTMLLYAVVAAVALAAARRPRQAGLYLLGVAVLLGAGALLGQTLTGGWFLRYALLGVHHAMQWPELPKVLDFMARQFLPYVLVIAAGIAVGGWSGGGAAGSEPGGAPRRTTLRDLLRDPWLVAFALSLPLQPIVLLKRGNMPNHLLGVCLLLVPLVLQAVEALLPRLRPRRAAAGVLAVLCLAWVAGRLAEDSRPLWRNLAQYDSRLAVVRRLETLVRDSKGEVWVPMGISLAYRNGAPVVAPALILAEFLPVTPAVLAPLLARLDRAEFERILVPALLFDLLPEGELEPRFRAHYRPTEVVGGETQMGIITPVVVLERRS